MQTLQLPRPSMNFTSTPSGGHLDMFALFRQRATSEGRMVIANKIGEAVLYDADKQLLNTLGCLNCPKGPDPMFLSIAHPGTEQDSLYVMNRFPGHAAGECFEVLEYTSEFSELSDMMTTWRWRLLPPPPFVLQPGYRPPSAISYTTMVDGNGCSTIFVSCDGGTYSFETARRDLSHRRGWRHSEEWKHVGKWKLPFNGRAEYIPEFNLWLGFSAFSPNHLCAVDLHDGSPTEQQVWQVLNPPEGETWLPLHLEFLHLGDGKFVVAETFETEATGEQFCLLIGIEMMHGVGDQSLQMIKHKCARFVFTNDTIQWVL